MNADLLLKADSLFDEEKFNEAIIFYERLDRNNYQCPKFYYNYAYSLKKEKYHSEVSWIGYKAIQIILEKEDQTECLELFVKCHILIGESYVQMCKKSLDTKYIGMALVQFGLALKTLEYHIGKKDKVVKQKLKAIPGEIKLEIIFDIVEKYSRIITEKKYQALKIQTYVESEIQYFASEKDSLSTRITKFARRSLKNLCFKEKEAECNNHSSNCIPCKSQSYQSKFLHHKKQSRLIPGNFVCQISKKIMIDPYLVEKKRKFFDKKSLLKTQGIDSQKIKKMRGYVAIRDDELRHEIEDFLKKNPWAYNYSRYDCFQNLDM
eukprot:403358394